MASFNELYFSAAEANTLAPEEFAAHFKHDTDIELSEPRISEDGKIWTFKCDSSQLATLDTFEDHKIGTAYLNRKAGVARRVVRIASPGRETVDDCTSALSAATLSEPDAPIVDIQVTPISSHLESEVRWSDERLGMSEEEYRRLTNERYRGQLELIRKNAVQTCRYERVFPIQVHSLPKILLEPQANLIAQAQGGAGKTCAFMLGILTKLDTRMNHTQAVCLGITRELANQIIDQGIVPLSQGFNPPVTYERVLKDFEPSSARCDRHIVCGTPGSISKHVKGGRGKKAYFDFSKVDTFVLDEADTFCDGKNFGDQALEIYDKMPPSTQSLLFSATFPREVESFFACFLRGRSGMTQKIVLKDHTKLMVPERKLYYFDINQFTAGSSPTRRGKLGVLAEIYENILTTQSIIFCEKKQGVDDVERLMSELGMSCSKLHSDMTGEERDESLRRFRENNPKEGEIQTRVLLTTNVLAKGVDIPTVGLVVNYDMPWEVKKRRADLVVYAHRIARCGRAGKKGIAVNFIESQQDRGIQNDIEKYYNPRYQTEPMILQKNPNNIIELSEEIDTWMMN